MFTVGIDIGGTKIAGALVNEAGELVRQEKVSSPATDSSEMAKSIIGLIRLLAEGEKILGVGVAAAGFLNAERSEVYYSPNINWRNEPIKRLITDQIDYPVLLENDANAAGWAEYRYGSGQGAKTMVMLTIGTGVGGAIVNDGKLFHGGFGIGGELGHIRMVPNGRDCGCGQKGCLESYASGTALLKAAKELVSSNDPKAKRLIELSALSGELTGTELYQAITEHDPGSLELLSDLGGWLGQAVASYAAALDPDVVVIGGGVSAADSLLLDPIRKSYLEHLPARGFRPELEVRKAHFLNAAGLVGVADLARQAFA
jgi:glucokinase